MTGGMTGELMRHRFRGAEKCVTFGEWAEALSTGETTILGGTLKDILEWRKAYCMHGGEFRKPEDYQQSAVQHSIHGCIRLNGDIDVAEFDRLLNSLGYQVVKRQREANAG